jgi:serine/threonine protein phosphatase PrpC
MEDRSCIINDFRPLGTADGPENATTTLCGVFDGHLSAKAADMAANNLHEHLAKGNESRSSSPVSSPIHTLPSETIGILWTL